MPLGGELVDGWCLGAIFKLGAVSVYGLSGVALGHDEDGVGRLAAAQRGGLMRKRSAMIPMSLLV
ncbi:MAG: hypothetical protein M2R45_03726 [Verrucomicrobia subdivision 3 bacterium]|nr:hypothetical protein [Limisphaerales bacterium]MCS1416950.1 hypothetical protein [Limisphaerales bacterium]